MNPETSEDETSGEATREEPVAHIDGSPEELVEVFVYGPLVGAQGVTDGDRLRFQGDLVEVERYKETPIAIRERNFRVGLWRKILATEVMAPDEPELRRRAALQQARDAQPALDAELEARVRANFRAERIRALGQLGQRELEQRIRDKQRTIAECSADLDLLGEALSAKVEGGK